MAKSKKGNKKAKRIFEDDPLDRDMSYLLEEKGRWMRFTDLFELQNKDKSITLRISEDLLNSVKAIAKKEDTNYQKLIREAIIMMVAKKVS